MLLRMLPSLSRLTCRTLHQTAVLRIKLRPPTGMTSTSFRMSKIKAIERRIDKVSEDDYLVFRSDSINYVYTAQSVATLSLAAGTAVLTSWLFLGFDTLQDEPDWGIWAGGIYLLLHSLACYWAVKTVPFRIYYNENADKFVMIHGKLLIPFFQRQRRGRSGNVRIKANYAV